MSQRAAGQRFRQRKLSTKQTLAVVRESDVDPLADDEASRHMPKVDTGVEKGEEIVSRAKSLSSTTTRDVSRPWSKHVFPFTFLCWWFVNTLDRSTTCKPSSLLPRLPLKALLAEQSRNCTFPHQKQLLASCSMNICTPDSSHNRQHTSGSLPRSRTRLGFPTA